ncbi:MAG: hypothetical protein JNJ88_16405 [Planctomycetes bacterium]|nr:hypothetical protein [Planctomycetota bacterium]
MKLSMVLRSLVLALAVSAAVVAPVIGADSDTNSGTSAKSAGSGSSSGVPGLGNIPPLAPGGGTGGTIGSLPCYDGTFGTTFTYSGGSVPGTGTSMPLLPNAKVLVPPTLSPSRFIWTFGPKPVARGNFDDSAAEREIRYNTFEVKQYAKTFGSVRLWLLDDNLSVLAVYEWK